MIMTLERRYAWAKERSRRMPATFMRGYLLFVFRCMFNCVYININIFKFMFKCVYTDININIQARLILSFQQPEPRSPGENNKIKKKQSFQQPTVQANTTHQRPVSCTCSCFVRFK